MSRNPILLAALALGAGALAGLAPVALATTPLTTVRVASGLTRPVFVTSPPGDERIFIVEQRGADNKGRIKILKNGTINPVPFLTTATLASGNEEGLLGLAFPPDYAATRAFYIYYTDSSGNNHVARHRTQVGNPDRADSIGTNVLTLLHPGQTNHNGGWIAFGPDGYLWVATGDGGSSGDPPNNAQNVNSFLGKLLRLAVDTTGTYTSPPDNPFVGVAGLDEIWTIGMRNPYRCSFDRETHDLLIGDVGQFLYEEVDYVPYSGGLARGGNFGWSCWEADSSYNLSRTTPCGTCTNTGCFIFPAYMYDHSAGRCAVTGGYVYRGCAIPDLRGTYFFGDYCGNQIYSGKFVGGDLVNFTDRTVELDPAGALTINAPSSFGEDKDGELYICDLGGEVFKIVPAAPVTEADQPSLSVTTVLGDALGSTGLGNAFGTGIAPFTHPGSRIRGVGYLKNAVRRGCETLVANAFHVPLTLGTWDIDLDAVVDPDSATLTRQFVFTNRAAGAAALDFRDVVAPFLENDADQAATYAPAGPQSSALLVLTDVDAPNRWVAHQGFATGAAFSQDVDLATSVEARVAADQPLSGATSAASGALALALGFDFGSVAPAARETLVLVTRLSVAAPLDAGDTPTSVSARILRALGPSPFRSSFGFAVDAPAGTGLRSLDVFDARGRLIVRLAGPQVLTGPRTITWDGRDSGGASVPSGLYFVRARTTLGDETLRAVRID